MSDCSSCRVLKQKRRILVKRQRSLHGLNCNIGGPDMARDPCSHPPCHCRLRLKVNTSLKLRHPTAWISAPDQSPTPDGAFVGIVGGKIDGHLGGCKGLLDCCNGISCP